MSSDHFISCKYNCNPVRGLLCWALFPHFFSLWEVYDFLERLGFEWAFVLSGACWFFTWECLVNPLSKHTSALYLMHGGGIEPAAAHFILWQASLKSPLLKSASFRSCTYSLCRDQPVAIFFSVARPSLLSQDRRKHPHECKWNANQKTDENTLLMGIYTF